MQSYVEYADLLKAFGDENRLRILSLLQDGEQCANSILDTLSIRQPTLSHHMKILCDSGVVVSRRQGKHTYYSLQYARIDQAKNFFNGLLKETEMPSLATAEPPRQEAPEPKPKRIKKKRRAVRDMEDYLL